MFPRCAAAARVSPHGMGASRSPWPPLGSSPNDRPPRSRAVGGTLHVWVRERGVDRGLRLLPPPRGLDGGGRGQAQGTGLWDCGRCAGGRHSPPPAPRCPGVGPSGAGGTAALRQPGPRRRRVQPAVLAPPRARGGHREVRAAPDGPTPPHCGPHPGPHFASRHAAAATTSTSACGTRATHGRPWRRRPRAAACGG